MSIRDTREAKRKTERLASQINLKDIEFAKIRENAKSPDRANPSDAGLDVFWCPDRDSKNYEFYPMDEKSKEKFVRVKPNESKLFGTGLKFNIPDGYMGEVMNRSSWAYKKQLIVGSHVIDSGYQGELMINLQNVGATTRRVYEGDKIAQLVIKPIATPRPIQNENLFDSKEEQSERGEGGFGSTGDR